MKTRIGKPYSETTLYLLRIAGNFAAVQQSSAMMFGDSVKVWVVVGVGYESARTRAKLGALLRKRESEK